MKDLPMFTTENGVASLTLQSIPYNAVAYITLQSAVDTELLLKECADFCKAVGAEHIYVCGSDLDDYPIYTEVWEMTAAKCELPQPDAWIQPVTADTLPKFLEIYRQKMRGVPTAAYLTQERARKHLETGNCYFISKDDILLGIGIAGGTKIDAIASLVPGGGREVLLALCNQLPAHRISLEVASQNHKAVALYESLGFSKEKVLNVWHKIL